MNHTLRLIYFLFVRCFVLILLGLNIRRKNLLPKSGPAIIVANHNSHLDTMVLISLFPLSLLPNVRPVAAADYFLKNKYMAWFSQKIIGIIPVTRGGGTKFKDPLEPCYEALERGEILILFPEGTRGEPEKISDFKKGVSWIVEKYPDAPVTPIFIHGLGKAMGKSDFLPVPFFCDIFVGSPLAYKTSKEDFMALLKEKFEHLASEEQRPAWE